MHEGDNIMLIKEGKRLWEKFNQAQKPRRKKLRGEKVQIMLMEKIKRMRSKLKCEG